LKLQMGIKEIKLGQFGRRIRRCGCNIDRPRRF